MLVNGDLTIAPQAQLVVHNHTQVNFTGRDLLAGGLDPDRCELRVEGELRVESNALFTLDLANRRRRVRSTGIEFAAQIAGETWYGTVAPYQLPAEIVLRDIERNSHAFGNAPTSSDNRPTAVINHEEEQDNGGLLSNYPNPFNPQTTIRYQLAESGPVRLVVYNVLGQQIRTLVDGFQGRGVQEVVWNGRNQGGNKVTSGNYLYRFETTTQAPATGRMLLVR